MVIFKSSSHVVSHIVLTLYLRNPNFVVSSDKFNCRLLIIVKTTNDSYASYAKVLSEIAKTKLVSWKSY